MKKNFLSLHRRDYSSSDLAPQVSQFSSLAVKCEVGGGWNFLFQHKLSNNWRRKEKKKTVSLSQGKSIWFLLKPQLDMFGYTLYVWNEEKRITKKLCNKNAIGFKGDFRSLGDFVLPPWIHSTVNRQQSRSRQSRLWGIELISEHVSVSNFCWHLTNHEVQQQEPSHTEIVNELGQNLQQDDKQNSLKKGKGIWHQQPGLALECSINQK